MLIRSNCYSLKPSTQTVSFRLQPPPCHDSDVHNRATMYRTAEQPAAGGGEREEKLQETVQTMDHKYQNRQIISLEL